MKNGIQNIAKSVITDGIRTGLLGSSAGRKRIESFLVKFTFSLVFVVLMWLSANSFVYLPFTPVPVTMQVMTVLLSALALGGYWAAFSQLEYIFLGIAGAPVFAGFKNGIAVLAGPTGGYIIGFVAAALAAGIIYKTVAGRSGIKSPEGQKQYYRRTHPMIVLISCLTGVMVIYSTGYLHFLGYISSLSVYADTGSLIFMAFKLAVAPFIMFDIIKILIILAIYRIVLNEKY